MNIGDIAGIALSALTERKTRSGLTILMVVIGAMLITSINGLNSGTNKFINDQFTLFAGTLIIVTPGEEVFAAGPPQDTPETPLTDQTVKTLSKIKWVETITPTIYGAVTMKKGSDERSVIVLGLNHNSIQYLVPAAELLDGKLLLNNDLIGIVLGYGVAFEEGEQKYNVGQTVNLEISKVEESGGFQKVKVEKKSFQVKGVFQQIGSEMYDEAVYLTVPAAKNLFDKGIEYDAIYLTTIDTKYNDEVEEDIRELYGKAIGITTPKSIAESINNIVGIFTGFISAIAFISLIVGAVGIITTLFTSVLERTREVGLLKALGFTNGMILSAFVIESMLIGLIGGTLGVAAGIGGAYVLGSVIPFQAGAGSIQPVFHIRELLEIWGIALGLSIVSGIYPAWRASRLNPLEAIRKM